MPDDLSLPQDPFSDSSMLPPDCAGIHDWYLALRAGGFDMLEALTLIAMVITNTKPVPVPDDKT